MLDNQYLLHGLNALSRAHEFKYFDDGHRGAAVIAGVYLCRENKVEAGVAETVAAIIDERWANTELCAPFPDEDSDPQLLRRVVHCMSEHMEGLQEAGHNVILPSLALKAFCEVPEAITPSRVMGVCRLIESFSVSQVPMDKDAELPSMEDPASAAEFILDEFIKCTERFRGRGQGWSGHLLTYGQALMDLRETGFADLADRAENSFRIYMRRIRMGPQKTDKQYDEHSPTGLRPLQSAYWKERGGDLNLGHKLKYPYGFYGLMNKARDPELKLRCLEIAYRIF